MSISTKEWSNKNGSGDQTCTCGTWEEHWLNFSNESWPESCSVEGCLNSATVGAHVINPQIFGERIVPMCGLCHQSRGSFNLKTNIAVPSAVTEKTCNQE